MSQSILPQLTRLSAPGIEFNCDHAYFAFMSNWGVFTNEEYKTLTVHRPEHEKNQKLDELLADPLFDDPRIVMRTGFRRNDILKEMCNMQLGLEFLITHYALPITPWFHFIYTPLLSRLPLQPVTMNYHQLPVTPFLYSLPLVSMPVDVPWPL